MKFLIYGNTYQINKGFLEKVANAAFSYLKLAGDVVGEIQLQFVSRNYMTTLNSRYRGHDKATDVLSFQISSEPLLGQVFICYNYTVAQAKKLDKSFEDEVALLLIHGILHVIGYDHSDKETELEMQQIETEILRGLNITR